MSPTQPGELSRYEAHKSEWDRIAETQEFKDLMATKKVFIIPAFVSFLRTTSRCQSWWAMRRSSCPPVFGRRQSGLPVRVVAVLHGVERRRAVHASRRRFDEMAKRILPTWTNRSSSESGEGAMSHAAGHVPGVHRHHAGDHLLGGATLSRSSAYFAAGRRITGWQNGIAVAGDYMSAASFLGIAGIIAFQGYDGFMYSVGWLVAYLTVLLIVAEPLRNAGKYTMADVLAYRLSPRPVRAMAALSTLTVSTFYMIAQMVGAGTLVALLLKGLGHQLQLGGDRASAS